MAGGARLTIAAPARSAACGERRRITAELLGNDRSLHPLKQLLITRTEGNPFFLEESVRTLVETKVLEGDRGVFRVAKSVESIQVPATVQAVLAARIDRLPAENKRLLQSAAVIGKDVPFVLLQAIADLSEEDLGRRLAHLQTGEFLYETSLFPELEYTFKHALTHEVAYGSLLQDRRRSFTGGSSKRLRNCIRTGLPSRLNCSPIMRFAASFGERLLPICVRPVSKRRAARQIEKQSDSSTRRSAC